MDNISELHKSPVLSLYSHLYDLMLEYTNDSDVSLGIVYKIYKASFMYLSEHHNMWTKDILFKYQISMHEFVTAFDYNGVIKSTHLIDKILSLPRLQVSGEFAEHIKISSETMLPTTSSITEVMKLSNNEFAPNSTLHIRDKIIEQSKQIIFKKTTNMYTCKICKEKDATYVIRQFRSSDESECIVLTCQSCGHIWHI
jgi:DNA-directed RNA polymerase subunit M/transcription elongation factor TFIIS